LLHYYRKIAKRSESETISFGPLAIPVSTIIIVIIINSIVSNSVKGMRPDER
jgi:hypothetical protein